MALTAGRPDGAPPAVNLRRRLRRDMDLNLDILEGPEQRFSLVCRDASEVARYQHDFLRLAAHSDQDVAILCSSLGTDKDQFFRTALKLEAKISFAEALGHVVETKGRVRILIWNENGPGLISDEMRRLNDEFENLEIRLSGTCGGSEELCSFLVSHGSHDLVYVAEPREVKPGHELCFVVPAMIYANYEPAQIKTKRILTIFEQLFEAAGHSRKTTTLL